MHFAARVLLKILRVELRVSRPIPQDHFIFANHQGWFDFVVLSALSPVRFIAKREVSAIPVIGRAATCVKTLFVDRGVPIDKQVKLKQDILTSKHPIACFPEGTTNAKVGKLKLGVLNFVEGIEKPAIAVFLRFDPQAPILFVGDEPLGQSISKLFGFRGKICVDITWIYLDLEKGKYSEQTSLFFKSVEKSTSEF